ncbi:MAG: hypothetical protein HOQ03_00415, partial [Thermoleophilia bacterium]|nr:hypothetical protein [Thermoleophilia bacterium]
MEIHSRDDPLLAAEEAFAAGRTEDARAMLEQALAGDAPPERRARMHQLHGWLDAMDGIPFHAFERLLTEAEA